MTWVSRRPSEGAIYEELTTVIREVMSLIPKTLIER